MKSFALLVIGLFLSQYSFSQDVILKNDGATILAKVMEVTTSEVKYKRFENLEGPTYSILKNELSNITYENGTKDVFSSVNIYANNNASTSYQNNQGSHTQALQPGSYIPVRFINGANSKYPKGLSAAVMADVKNANGEIVIKYGTPVELSVVSQKARGCGRPGVIVVNCVSTQSVNGQMIPLDSTPYRVEGKNKRGLAIGLGVGLGCTFFLTPGIACLAIKGGQAEISPNETIPGVRVAY